MSSGAGNVAPPHVFQTAPGSDLELCFHKSITLMGGECWKTFPHSLHPLSQTNNYVDHAMSQCKGCSERRTTLPLPPKSTRPNNRQNWMGIHSVLLSYVSTSKNNLRKKGLVGGFLFLIIWAWKAKIRHGKSDANILYLRPFVQL